MGSLQSSEEDEGDAGLIEDQEAALDEQFNYEGAGVILKIHQVNNYTPITSSKVVASLFRGSELVRTFANQPCRFETTPRDYGRVREDPSGVQSNNDKAVGKNLRLGEQCFWE